MTLQREFGLICEEYRSPLLSDPQEMCPLSHNKQTLLCGPLRRTHRNGRLAKRQELRKRLRTVLGDIILPDATKQSATSHGTVVFLRLQESERERKRSSAGVADRG
ncbi:hypothetical protein TNCV_2493851 [Trichonephila clavipes]|uniref:Uncharacterized protein n=1 Tax=Trichonephila clavipes TaxID=2585209 RepID=A0A8X6RUP3_TRICX|nr:hypothetical protein TNCV_2493851 [Trichonephila clavipes]